MTDARSHPTLREWRDHLVHPATLAGVVGVAAILTVLAPFGTEALFRLLPRFGYWLAMTAATYAAGYWISETLWRRLASRMGRAGIIALVALCTGAGVSVVVLAVNRAALGHWPSAAALPGFLGQVLAIAAIVTVLFAILEGHLGQPAQAAVAPTPPPAAPILDRVTAPVRGPLVALSAEDHYVRIRTTKGEEMVLLRLADAMGETGETPGMQVHRSHWVALDAVTAARRKGDCAVLTMSHGPEVPVSRRHVPAIREAGLLPR